MRVLGWCPYYTLFRMIYLPQDFWQNGNWKTNVFAQYHKCKTQYTYCSTSNADYLFRNQDVSISGDNLWAKLSVYIASIAADEERKNKALYSCIAVNPKSTTVTFWQRSLSDHWTIQHWSDLSTITQSHEHVVSVWMLGKSVIARCGIKMYI